MPSSGPSSAAPPPKSAGSGTGTGIGTLTAQASPTPTPMRSRLQLGGCCGGLQQRRALVRHKRRPLSQRLKLRSGLGEKGEIKARQLRGQIKGEGLLGTRPCSPQAQRFQPPKATLTRTRKMPENKGEAQAFQAACHTLPGKLTLAAERRPDCPGQRGAGRPLSSSGMRPALQHALEQPNTGSHGEMQPDNGLQESHG